MDLSRFLKLVYWMLELIQAILGTLQILFLQIIQQIPTMVVKSWSFIQVQMVFTDWLVNFQEMILQMGLMVVST
ncbi:hypothetical protein [Streptococcus suis]|uniref:hypothetical protein n=1 Tax=Streptococcus suis TaxID=1307 RepID=UPI001298D009|nr:hypothetical protein [Streptococcus suis]MDY7333292.1 hypothetical protein [Streptococcus suis]